MNAATSARPASPGVFVPITPLVMAKLDSDRAKLGLSRGATLREIYLRFGDDVVEGLQHQAAIDEAGAQSLAQTLQPLVEAMKGLTEAYVARAHQLNAIGVHTNQMAKLGNAGGNVPADALAAMARAIDELHAELATDAPLLAEVRSALHGLSA